VDSSVNNTHHLVVDDFEPTHSLDIEWSSKSYASLGNTLKPKKLQDTPTVSLTPYNTTSGASDMTYVIAVTDPDAPSRDNPEWSEMCHWITSGVSASSGAACSKLSLSGLEDVVSYKPPGPPPKTGKHRYVFVGLVAANGTTDKLNLTKPVDRQHWGSGKERHGLRDWALENGLEPVGECLAHE
jgi:phosphatidylethanolamine-binding protein